MFKSSPGPSKCQLKSVVYVGTCQICERKYKENPSIRHAGKYVGETSRTLAERVKEHRAALRRYDQGSFMFKHWALAHPELDNPPDFEFSVVKKHKDPMSRLVHEAVRILDEASLNSKAEWGGYRIARLSVEKTDKDLKKHLEISEGNYGSQKGEMSKLKERVIALARHSKASNADFVSRKRMSDFSQNLEVNTPQQAEKRPKMGLSGSDFSENVTSTPAGERPVPVKCDFTSSVENVSSDGFNSRSSDYIYFKEAAEQVDSAFALNELKTDSSAEMNLNEGVDAQESQVLLNSTDDI